MRKRLFAALRIGVTVVGLAIVLTQVDLGQIGRSLIQARLSWLLVGFLLVNLSMAVRAYRWLLLLRGLGVSVRFGRLVILYFVGNFFNMALPSGFGGDVVRALEATRDVPGSVAAGTVILDRLTGLIMLFVMGLLLLPLRPDNFPAEMSWIIVTGAVGGVVGGFVLLEGSLIRRFGSWLPGPLSPVGDGPVARLLKAVQGCGWPAIRGALAVSVLFNLILSAWWATSGLALGEAVDFGYYVLVMPLLSVPLLIPSISGLGPRELIAPAVFSVVGLAPETAVSISFLVFIITRLSGLLGAPLYIFTTVRESQAKRKRQESTAESASGTFVNTVEDKLEDIKTGQET